MIWLFALLGLGLIVAIGLVLVGRETARLASVPRPSVFDLNEAVEFVADRLSPAAQGRLSHDDVRWILTADVDLLEDVASDDPEGRYPWSRRPTAPSADDGSPAGPDLDPAEDVEHTVDEDLAVARILAAADGDDRDLDDADVAEVLDGRTAYLRAIGAIGDEIDR